MKNMTKILTLLFLLNLGLYANTVGTITALSGSAAIQRDAKSIDATLGAKLQQKDNIKTSDATKVQIIFNDETIISIGKNSSFSIDEFLFEQSDAPSAKFVLLSGAMRAITGKIGDVAPDKFSVKTKTATIGIRGTNFSIFAKEDGSAKVFCTLGVISVSALGTSSIVNQGFYIEVSIDGTRSEPIKYTPQELKEVEQESFTSASTQKASSSDLEESDKFTPMAQTPIDTKSTEELALMVESITEITADTIQTQTAKNEQMDEPTQPEVNEQSLDGYALNATQDYEPTLKISLKAVGSTFSDAYIKDNVPEDLDYNIPAYTITYEIASTPSSFTSMEDFTYKIVGASTTNAAVTDIELNQESNLFRAIPDDLESGDSMSWGEWEVSGRFNYHEEDYVHESEDYYETGLWIAGEITPNLVINNYRNDNKYGTYEGKYMANYFSNDAGIAKGDATLRVDFGRDIVSLDIARDASNRIIPTTINGTIVNDASSNLHNQIQANNIDNQNNYFDGRFYGADGKSAGGSFTIMDGSTVNAKGVYQVKTNELHVEQPHTNIGIAR